EARGDRRRGDAVLARARFGDDARLAHAAGELDLPEAVVDLVRARVIELLALEIDLGAAELLGQPLGEIERARPAGIMRVEILEFGDEGGVVLRLVIGFFEIEDEGHQRLGDEAAAKNAEAPALVRARSVGIHFGTRAHVYLFPVIPRRAGRPMAKLVRCGTLTGFWPPARTS